MRAAPALAAAASIAAGLAAAPLLVAVVLGAPALPRACTAPAFVAATLRSLLLGEASVALGWPAGVVAALAIWGASQTLRRLTLGAALLVLLAPPTLTARGFAMLATRIHLPDAWLAMLLAGHAAQAAAAVTLVMTGALNRLDPAMLRSAEASGAGPWQARRLVLLPPLAMWLAWAAAAAFVVSLGQTVLDAALTPPHHDTLSGLVAVAARHADVATAPALLALYAMASVPLVLLVLMLRWLEVGKASGPF